MVPYKNCFGNHAFESETEKLLNSLDLSIKFVFALDLVLGFRKSYLNTRSGQEIKDPKLIMRKYLKFYFWIDIVSALPFDLLMENPGITLRSMQLIKMIRFSRLSKIVSFLNLTNQTRLKIRLLY